MDRNRSNRTALALTIFLVLGMALTPRVSATEYYTYEDAAGKLVISNKKPPPGSRILKKQDLPDPADDANTPGQEAKAPADTPADGGMAKPKQ
jgi:hypothetical protein